MDQKSSILTFIQTSDGRTHDINILVMIPIIAGSIYNVDHTYLDYEHLYHPHNSGDLFVILAKKNLWCYRKYSIPVDRSTGQQHKHRYPEPLRCLCLIYSEN